MNNESHPGNGHDTGRKDRNRVVPLSLEGIHQQALNAFDDRVMPHGLQDGSGFQRLRGSPGQLDTGVILSPPEACPSNFLGDHGHMHAVSDGGFSAQRAPTSGFPVPSTSTSSGRPMSRRGSPTTMNLPPSKAFLTWASDSQMRISVSGMPALTKADTPFETVRLQTAGTSSPGTCRA